MHNLYSSNKEEGTRIDKNGEEMTKYISYILQFIDSTRLSVSSLSNLVNNLSGRIHKIKYKYRHNNKNWNLWNYIQSVGQFSSIHNLQRWFNRTQMLML